MTVATMSDSANSNIATKTKPLGGIIFYPRQYVVGESVDESYAIGVNHLGESCVAYIRPTDAAREAARNSSTAQTIPSISLFAETDRRASNPCFASPANSPKTPAGVFVLEQVILDSDLSISHDGLPVYVGRWASVIREDEESPVPIIGPGYMEINFRSASSDQLTALSHEYRRISREIESNNVINVMDAEIDRQSIKKQIMMLREKHYVCVIMKTGLMRSLVNPSRDDLKEMIFNMLSYFTVNGLYAGVLLRVRVGKRVFKDFCVSCISTYDYKNSCVFPIDQSVENFLKFNFGKISRGASIADAVVELIPCQRINCGPRGTDKYNKQFDTNGTPKIIKTFVDKKYHDLPLIDYVKENAFMFCHLATRLSEIRGGRVGAGNLLLSTAHAFSQPLGNPYTVNKSGLSEYTIE